jgi:hypothetical protein
MKNSTIQYVIWIACPPQYYSGGHVSCAPTKDNQSLVLARKYDSIGSAKTSIAQGKKQFQSCGRNVLDEGNSIIKPVRVSFKLV